MLTAKEVDDLRHNLESLSQQAADAAQQRHDLINKAVDLIAERDRLVFYWWCRYLDVFLVPRTKLVLEWLSVQAMAPTPRACHLAWTPLIPDEQERETILTVLLNFGLIAEEGGLLRVTEHGNFFLRFRRGQEVQP